VLKVPDMRAATLPAPPMNRHEAARAVRGVLVVQYADAPRVAVDQSPSSPGKPAVDENSTLMPYSGAIMRSVAESIRATLHHGGVTPGDMALDGAEREGAAKP
jgi:hypothetical protein